MSEVDPRWYDGFFEAEWLDYLALPEDPERTPREVDFVVEALALEPGARILDLACGRGRHSIELASRGFVITGVDLSPRSLELARAAASSAGADVSLVQADMREIDFASEFDAVVNLFTSFGYFERQDEDERVLAAVARALRPGGGFVLDTINPLTLMARFREREWRELEDGTLMFEIRSFDHLRGRVAATWTFVRRDGSRAELHHSLRTYTPPELVAMLGRAGLELERTWGGFDGSDLGEGSRIVLLARRA